MCVYTCYLLFTYRKLSILTYITITPSSMNMQLCHIHKYAETLYTFKYGSAPLLGWFPTTFTDGTALLQTGSYFEQTIKMGNSVTNVKQLEIFTFMQRLCVDYMIQQGFHIQTHLHSRPTGKIQTHWQNPDPLVKSRPTGWDTKLFTL